MKTKTNKPTNFFDYPMKIKKEIVSKTVENANKMQLETFNKTNNDWRDDLISLFIGMKLSMKNKLEIDDFISNLLQQQREEIIKEIQSDILDFLQEANDEDGIPPMVSEYFNSFYQFLENK
jgi:hypothetical protein